MLRTSACFLVGSASGHGAMTLPATRMSTSLKKGGLCEGTDPTVPYQNETCFWFNEGCSIGCNSCSKDCSHVKSAFGFCCPEQIQPTNNDPRTRTFKDLFGKLDVAMRFNPWRAPGFAPVYDPCGLAGGMLPGEAGKINPPPPGVPQGMRGQDLPEVPALKMTWAAGSVQEVAWGINANHGGGYAYRLCPKVPGQNLTEECFQKHHLQFVGTVSWVHFGRSGNRSEIPAVRVTEGTKPTGSSWTRNPIPACQGVTGGGVHTRNGCEEAQFEPPLADVVSPHATYAPLPGLYGFGMGHCVGIHLDGSPFDACKDEELDFWRERFHFSIVDLVQIPADLPAGEYAVSFRWDSEQTPQVWANCADVQIVAGEAMV